MLTTYSSRLFQQHELHMYGDSLQIVFSAVGFLRARLTCTSGEIKKELAFVLDKPRVAPMKALNVTKWELQDPFLSARLKREICRTLSIAVDRDKGFCGQIDPSSCSG